MKKNHRKIGDKYEDLAVSILKNNNYEILARNYVSHHGEIDIIARDKNTLVFIEVKFRKNLRFDYGSASIDKNKLKHMYYTACDYIYKNNINEMEMRFDSICFLKDKYSWEKNILWGDEIGF